MKRVVITGIGPVSAIGIGREPFFDALREGRSGIADIVSFDASPYRSRRAAELRNFAVSDYLESQKNYLDRVSELAFAAMSLALEDANLDPRSMDGAGAGLLLGSAFGSLATMGLFFRDFIQKGPRFVKPVLFPHTYPNTAISLLAMEYNLSGYHVNVASGCVSAACAIVAGFDLIRQGRATLAFAGGAEGFNEILFAGFDAGGRGVTLGEGAGILVLEEREQAEARGARILGVLTGAGMTAGFRIEAAMRLALDGGPFPAPDLDLIQVHANGDRELDALEAGALDALAPGVARAAVKPLIGETLGAGGALQMAAALAALESGRTPAGKIRRVLVNTLDPGGSAVCLALKRIEA